MPNQKILDLLEKAIELLNVAKEGWPVSGGEKYYKALELGIEALKWTKDNPILPKFYMRALLPGETKE